MGKPIDKRVDVWAFGVVLYQMLTGRRAFDGEDVSGIAGRRAQGHAIARPCCQAETPSSIRRLLHRCLEKDRRERLGDMSAARLDIKDALAAEPTSAGAKLPSALGTRAASGLGGRASDDHRALAVCLPSRTSALRPNGPRYELPDQHAVDDQRVFVCALARRTAPRVRRGRCRREPAVGATRLIRARAEPLAGTEEATYPFWSPDSQSIAFFASGWLKRLDIGSGLPRPLAKVFAPRGGSWSADGVILFAPTVLGPLWQVSDSGGEPHTGDEIGTNRVQGLTCFRSSFRVAAGFCFTCAGTRTTRVFIFVLWTPEDNAPDRGGDRRRLPGVRLAALRPGRSACGTTLRYLARRTHSASR